MLRASQGRAAAVGGQASPLGHRMRSDWSARPSRTHPSLPAQLPAGQLGRRRRAKLDGGLRG
eukprot:9427739-Lingulodinium_polyedra.AAC.1